VLNNIILYLKEQNKLCCLLDIKKDFFKFFLTGLKKNDFIITPDPFVTLCCLILKPLSYKHFIYFSFEMYGYTKPNRGIKNKTINFIWHILQFTTLLLASKVIFSNKLRRDFYITKYSWIQKKSYILENYCIAKTTSLNDLSPEFKNKIDNLIGNHKIWVSYAGSIHPGRDINVLINAFDKAKNSNLGLILAGQDNLGITDILNEKANPDIIYLGNLSFQEIIYLYTKINFGFMDYSNDYLNTKYAAPVKIYEYLQYNLGIICNMNYAMQEKNDLIDFYYKDESELVDIFKKLNTAGIKGKDTKSLDFNNKFGGLLDEIGI
jgi:hypothetical protein